MSDVVTPTSYDPMSERRSHPRYPISSSCVLLENDNAGIVLDVCDRGLSMRVVRSLADERSAQIRFQLGRSRSWIETRVRVAWTNPTGTTAGVEFELLAGEDRILLTRWISSIASLGVLAEKDDRTEDTTSATSSVADHEEADEVPSVRKAEQSEEPIKSLDQESSDLPLSFVAPSTNPQAAAASSSVSLPERFLEPEVTGQIIPIGPGRHRDRSLPIIISATLVLLVLGLLLVWLWGNKRKNATTVSQPTLPTASPQSQLNPPTPAAPPPTPAASNKAPGFVVQAGAMREEENATALVRSLQAKKFPAFTFKSDADRFYEVLVGPYADAQTAQEVRQELRGQGFETMLKHWPSHPTGQTSDAKLP